MADGTIQTHSTGKPIKEMGEGGRVVAFREGTDREDCWTDGRPWGRWDDINQKFLHPATFYQQSPLAVDFLKKENDAGE